MWSPDGFRMAFVSEGALWMVPVDERGGATGPPQAVATDQPESPSWEGDSKHIVYQTPRGLRRIIADGSLPEPIPLDLTWRNGATPERIVVHAGHVLDGVLEAVRGEADIVIESRRHPAASNEHRDDLHTGAVVDASNEYVMPGLDRDARASRRRLRRELRQGVAGLRHHQPADSVDQPVRRPRAARGVRRRPPAGPARVPRRRSVRRRARLLPGRRVGDLGRAARTRARSRVGARRRLLQDLRPASRSSAEAGRGVRARAEQAGDVARALSRRRVRHRRHRAPRRHQPPRLLAEARRSGTRLSGCHRSDREVRRHVDADDRHHRRVSRAGARRQGAALRPAAGADAVADGGAADRHGGVASGAAARRAAQAIRGDAEGDRRRRRHARSPAPTRRSCRTDSGCTSSSSPTCTRG